jgi:hypothetical protein
LETRTTTLEDQTDVAVTAYNNGRALVRDVRHLTLPDGESQLRFSGVASLIQPETVGLRSLSDAGSIIVLEQNYEYDLISPEKLMEKYVGEEVTIRTYSDGQWIDEKQATLLSTNNGAVYEVEDQIYLGYPGTVIVPRVPDNLIAKPSLIWTINNDQNDQTIEATYLTGGISWKADYVLNLDRNDKRLDISGWVTMNNQSGATYENAKLKLVAGDVNIVQDRMAGRGGGGGGGMVMAASMPQEETFAEYHLYTMPRRTTIKQNQSKQLALLSASGVDAHKEYEYRGQQNYFFHPWPNVGEEKVQVYLVFQNDEDNQLGIPLPAGVMRIYQEDSEGMLQFAGEDRVDHTPKDEEVRLNMGNAFDVVAERKQTDFKQVTANLYESAFEITLRNHKDQDITVDVVERVPGDWTIIENSHDYEKREAFEAAFPVEVPSDGETVVTYRIQVKQR